MTEKSATRRLDAFRRAPRDLRRALRATLFFGAASGIFGATLNNYLVEVHALDAGARGWLELPRELPGFFIKKIAEDPSDITPTISLGITIDHAVAMTLPVLSGCIWEAYCFRWVFLLAGAIAVVGFFVCLQIRVPEPRPFLAGAPAIRPAP